MFTQILSIGQTKEVIKKLEEAPPAYKPVASEAADESGVPRPRGDTVSTYFGTPRISWERLKLDTSNLA